MPRKSDWSLLSIDSINVNLKNEYRFHFKLDSEAASTLVLLLYRMEMLGILMNHEVSEDARIDSNILHVITLYCATLPILYLMLLIGHYSKTGCMVIGRIVPLVHGVGFTMAIMSFIHCVFSMIIATDSLIFLYYSMVPGGGMPWMVCGSDVKGECLGFEELKLCQRTPVETPCTTSNEPTMTILSAYHYRRDVLMEIDSDSSGSQICLMKVVSSAASCIALAFITDLNFKSGRSSTVILIIHIVMQILVLMIVTFLSIPYETPPELTMHSGFLDVFKVNFESLLDPGEWIHTYLFMVQSINAATVSSALIGSYMPRKSKADLFALEVVLILLFLYILGEILISSCMSALAINVRVRKGTLFAWYQDNLFVAVPQLFGMSDFSPKLLALIFYFYLFITNIWRTKLILSAIYESFADIKPIIRIYKFYIRTFSCILIFLVCLPVYIQGFLDHCLYFIRFVEYTYLAVIHAIVTCSILYIYGAQKICDDHHFIYGSQPVTFYRVMLILTPIIYISLWMFMYLNIYRSAAMSQIVQSAVFISFFFTTLIPHLLGMLYKVIFYLKQQNMIHLLKSEDDWGDPNPQVRKERIIYHPRKENKYFRRLDICKHECLRYNHILPLIVTEESMNHRLSYLLQKRNLFTKSEVGIGKLPYDLDI